MSQSLENYEIIIIDDGSTDGSEKICDELKSLYPSKINVIHQHNKGLCETRRVGLRVAKGNYIGFVDSDDWVDKDMFKKMHIKAIETNADIVLCDVYKCGDNKLQLLKGFKGEGDIDPKKFLKSFSPGFMCNKLYKCSLIDKMINDHNGVQAEDLCVNLPLMCKIDTIAYVDEPLYYYYQRATASSNADAFSKKNSIHDHLSALRYILSTTKDMSIEYKDLIVDYVLECVCVWALANPARECYIANYVEFLQEILPAIQDLPCFERREKLRNRLNISIIPKKIYKFAMVETDEVQRICNESLQFYANDYTFHELKYEDIFNLEMPSIVKEAIEKNEVKFVRDYLELRTLYEHGGIYIGNNQKFNLPIGGLRANKCFFAFKDKVTINDQIFGTQAKNEVIKDILDTYYQESYLNDISVSLERRIYFVLVGKYAIKEGLGKKEKIFFNKEECGCVFGFDKCSYKINKTNVTNIYNSAVLEAEKNNLCLIDSNILEDYDKNYEDAKRRLSDYEKKCRTQNKTIEQLKNSKSWKITAPLRYIANKLRNIIKGRNK